MLRPKRNDALTSSKVNRSSPPRVEKYLISSVILDPDMVYLYSVSGCREKAIINQNLTGLSNPCYLDFAASQMNHFFESDFGCGLCASPEDHSELRLWQAEVSLP